MGPTLEPLFDAIVERIPPPDVDADAPAQLLVTTTSYDDYKGRIALGRLQAGTLRRGQAVARIDHSGTLTPARVTQLYTFQGLDREEVAEARAGEIVAVAGVVDVGIGDTIADASDPRPLPPIRVEEPTLRMTFAVNTSPFAGREGTHVTSRKLRDRLYAELERDVALRVADGETADALVVSGRGELHLAILIENLRREGYELQVSRPEVIFREADGQRLEPYEQLEIEVAQESLGQVVELAGQRRGELIDMKYREDGSAHCVYRIPTRGLLGFRQAFLTGTRGQGVMNTLFADYGPYAGPIASRTSGSLVAWEDGTATTFGLTQAQERGQLFIDPGVEVYEGMVVGEHVRERDLEVNVVRRKHLTNMRASNSEITVRLDGVRDLSLDDAIEFLADDELLEVTPVAYRIRKRVLAKQDRDRIAGQKKKERLAV
ncbi:MAG: EF-Tu/IF-2/RF-3 family GTPase [Candidatus Limnocylindria bacterium]